MWIPHVNRQTDREKHTAENITSPQLRWRVVKMHIVGNILNVFLALCEWMKLHVELEKLQMSLSVCNNVALQTSETMLHFKHLNPGIVWIAKLFERRGLILWDSGSHDRFQVSSLTKSL